MLHREAGARGHIIEIFVYDVVKRDHVGDDSMKLVGYVGRSAVAYRITAAVAAA